MRISTTAQRLSELMRERNLNQTDILEVYNRTARQLGEKELGKGALSQYVNGKVEPKQDKVYILAKALNVSEPWLMGYDSSRERVVDDRRLAFSPVNFARRPSAFAYRQDAHAGNEWEQMLDALQGCAEADLSADEEEVVQRYRGLSEAQRKRFKSLLQMVEEWGNDA